MPSDSPSDPAEIPAYSVIRAAYRFQDESSLKSRLLVCVGHQADHAVCLKVTSRVERFRSRPELMAGVVFFRAGEVDCFDRDSMVQPDNPVAIPHATLKAQRGSGDFFVAGQLPETFPEKLARAVGASVTMSPREKDRLTSFLGF